MLGRKSVPVLVLALAAVVLVLLSSLGSEAAKNTEEGVFIHIKSGPQEAHSVLMGLQMAKIMAESRAVLVYVDVAGIEAVTQGGPDLGMDPFGSSKQSIKDLLASGVTVMACPGCMKAKGVVEEDLIAGIQVAQKDVFFDFTSGRILSLTY